MSNFASLTPLTCPDTVSDLGSGLGSIVALGFSLGQVQVWLFLNTEIILSLSISGWGNGLHQCVSCVQVGHAMPSRKRALVIGI